MNFVDPWGEQQISVTDKFSNFKKKLNEMLAKARKNPQIHGGQILNKLLKLLPKVIQHAQTGVMDSQNKLEWLSVTLGRITSILIENKVKERRVREVLRILLKHLRSDQKQKVFAASWALAAMGIYGVPTLHKALMEVKKKNQIIYQTDNVAYALNTIRIILHPDKGFNLSKDEKKRLENALAFWAKLLIVFVSDSESPHDPNSSQIAYAYIESFEFMVIWLKFPKFYGLGTLPYVVKNLTIALQKASDPAHILKILGIFEKRLGQAGKPAEFVIRKFTKHKDKKIREKAKAALKAIQKSNK